MTTLAEVLGPELASADLGGLDHASRQLRHVGELADEVRARLGSLSAGAWEGPGAAAFEQTQHGPLPADLAKMESSFQQAGSAVGHYRGSTGHILDRGRQIVAQLNDALQEEQSAGAEVGRTQSALALARRQATTAKGSGDPAATATAHRQLDAAGRAAGGAQRRRDAARQRVAQLQRQASDLRDEHRVAVSSFIGAMHSASEAGIGNSFASQFERYVVNPIRDHVDVLEILSEALDVAATLAGIIGLVCAVIPFLQPVAAVALIMSAVLGGIGLGLKLIAMSIKNGDPADTRSDQERLDESKGAAVDALFLLPFSKVAKPIVKLTGQTKRVEKISKHVHRDNYRPHPSEGTVEHKRGYLERGDPKTYEGRHQKRLDLEDTRNEALEGAPDLYKSAIEKGQADPSGTAGVSNADPRGRSSYRVEVRPCVITGTF